ncbi:M14 family zinc carboxypeptidase [Microlunatus soli]|uniref:Zinc carboxypeptidase n=1 Tax=Microlunatus soli TaxID=630515 RepID=A0A1H1NXV9_9ACTN|nr:M14 family zinc carboxypeptidase [Microlunatus soli]SDS03818.1 Zinc carboxypeptidase [Microlunatus soli]
MSGGTSDRLATILQRVDRIPDYDHFPGVDELIAAFDRLADDHPDRVSRRRIGTSRLGEPLWMYAIGRGHSNALVYAGVHPNEPIGFCTALQLATELCTDQEFADDLDCRWWIIPNIDPDGTRLNEGWFTGPVDRVTYARHFYRPAPAEQVEWAFPLSYKDAYFDAVIPEAFALMRVIDDVRPDIAVSLHNGELGGVYYYLSRPVPGMVETLHRITEHAGLPLDNGEPESPVAEQYGPAVFGMIDIERVYDHLEQLGVPPDTGGAGASSASYADRHGTLSLVAELPYWTHPAIDDRGPSGRRYAELLREAADELDSDMAALGELYRRAEPWLSHTSQLVRATAAFLPSLTEAAGSERARAAETDRDRIATVAEEFSVLDRNRCFRLRYGGMLVRAVASEVGRGAAPADLHRVHRDLVELYSGWQREAAAGEPDLRQVPINRLVGVQYAATLALLQARQAGS